MIKLFLILISLNMASLKVTGLTCSMCSFSVQKGLEKVQSIKSVEPNLEETTFEITFKDDVFIDFNLIENAVLDAGFFVDKESVKVNLTNNNNFNTWKYGR
jgi:copper chaperone CopZ